MSEIGNVALQDLVPQPTKKKGLGPSDPSSLREISNRPLYEENILKLQRYVKSSYGTDMSYEQASGIMRQDPNASMKVNINLPTMAFKDQELHHSVKVGGLTGTYRRPGLPEDEPGVRTIEGNQLDLNREKLAEEIRQNDLLLNQRKDEFAQRIGLDRDVFMEGVRTYNLGRVDELDRFLQTHGLKLKQFTELVRQYNETSAEDTRRFEMTYEQRQDEFALRMELDRDVFVEGVRMFNVGRLDDLEQFAKTHKLDLEKFKELIREYNETAAEDARRFNLTFAEQRREYNETRDQKAFEFSQTLSLERDVFMEGVRIFNLGRSDDLVQFAQTHNLEVDKFAEDVRRYNADEATRRFEFLETLGFSREELEQRTDQFDANLLQRQAEHAATLEITDRQFAEMVRQYDQGRTDDLARWAQSLGLDTDRLNEEIRKFNLTRDDQIAQFAQTFGLSEQEFIEMVREFNVNVEVERERIASQFDLAKLAQMNRVDILEIEAVISEEAEDRAYTRQLFFQSLDETEAEKTRLWKSIENALDRVFKVEMQDTEMTWEEKQAKLDRRQRSLSDLAQGGAIISAEIVTALMQRFVIPGPSGKPAVSADVLYADHLSGATATAEYWMDTPGMTEEGAAALAKRYKDKPLYGKTNPYLKADGTFTTEGRTAYDRVMDLGGTADEAAAYVRQEGAEGEIVNGKWVPAGDGTTTVIGDIPEGITPTGVTPEGLETGIDTDGNIYTRDEGGEWSTGNVVDGAGTTTPDDEPGNFEGLVSDVKGLSGRDIIAMGLNFTAGYATAEIVNSDANVWTKALALGPGVGAAIQGGPLTIGAYAVGFMANAIWRSHNQTDPGTKRRYEWAAPIDHRPPGIFNDNPGEVMMMVDWHADPDKPFAQDGGNLYDPNTARPGTVPGVVYWVHVESGQEYMEPLSAYQERTGRQMMTFYGAEAQLYDGLPPELKEKLTEEGFKPTFILINSDGSMTFLNRAGDKSVLLEPDEVSAMFGGDAALASAGGSDDEPESGQTKHDVLLASAITASPLSAEKIKDLWFSIGDDRRREKFLQRLAHSVPFTREDINDIFFWDEDAPEGYRYLLAWQQFEIYAEQNLIVKQSDEEIG